MVASASGKARIPARIGAMDYEISTDKGRLDRAAIHAFLAASYWSPGIPEAVVARAIEHSLCFGVFHDGAQVGFARVVTDRATFGYLADVYLLEAHRGRGLARRLVGEILAHPDLQGLRRLLLATRDAHGLYAKFGFRPLAAPDRMMEIHRPDVYRTPGR
jgi:GNAT superfamily N-acetyltransferase